MKVIIEECHPGELATDLASGGDKLKKAAAAAAHAALSDAAKLPADGEVHAIRELADLYGDVYSRRIPAMVKAAVDAVREAGEP